MQNRMQPNFMNRRNKLLWQLFLVFFILYTVKPSGQAQQEKSFQRVDGYKGIWFELGQKYPYGDKYSGGLGTYTAKHVPMAVYDSVSNKTYFVYGGTTDPNKKHLLCMIGYFDHETKEVPHPVMVFNKHGVDDPHDNPSLMLDKEGYIWVFVSGRGQSRSGYKYRSLQPHAIDTFQQITREEMTYPQPWYVPQYGYFHFFTKYTGRRELYFESSSDGFTWTGDKKLAGIKRPRDKQGGHYQVSNHYKNKVGTFFNWHPNGNVDKRTNLYYIESDDAGSSWQTSSKQKIKVPVEAMEHPSLVAEYFSEGKNVYLKDMNFDKEGNPIALFIVSNGHEPGPDNGLRHWKTAYWNNNDWEINDVCTSDHNYDMGSLYVSEHFWWVIAPTHPGPQPWGVGGEMVIWESSDKGNTWNKVMQVTNTSNFNHSYLRRPVNAHPEFYGFWADGDPYKFSKSRLYFMNKAGKVFQLPYKMDKPIHKISE